MHSRLRAFFGAVKRARAASSALALGIAFCASALAAPRHPPAAEREEPAFNGSIAIDGPAVRIDAKKPGRLVRLRFAGKAGERLGLGLSGIELAPESASTLVVTLRGPDGGIVPGAERMHCFAETDLHPIDGCDGQFTLAASGTHVIEVDTPFTATARFRASLSTPVAATVAPGEERSVAVNRIGQDARFRVAVASGKEVTVSARDASPGRGGGDFVLRLFGADGKQLARAEGTPELGASLPVRGDGGEYWVEVDPAHAKTGVFLVSARSAAQLSVDGEPVEFATRGPNEVLRFGFGAEAGQGLALAVDGLVHHPDVDSNSRFFLLAPDGSRVAFASCFTHVIHGLAVQPCKLIVPALPASGRYTIEVSPPIGATVSGRLLLTDVVKGTLSPGAPVALGPMKAGQVARYTFTADAGQRVSVRLGKIAASPAADPVRVLLAPEKGFGMFMSGVQRGAEVTLGPAPIAAAGTYVVVVDPVNGSLRSGELALTVEEGKPQ